MEYKNLERYAEDLFLCARCGDCSLADKTVASGRDVFHPCAVKNVLGFEAYAYRGRIMIMNDLLAGADYDTRLILFGGIHSIPIDLTADVIMDLPGK